MTVFLVNAVKSLRITYVWVLNLIELVLPTDRNGDGTARTEGFPPKSLTLTPLKKKKSFEHVEIYSKILS